MGTACAIVAATIEAAAGRRLDLRTSSPVIPALVDLYLAGRLPFDRLVRTYPFDRINDAAHDMHAGTVFKSGAADARGDLAVKGVVPVPADFAGALPGLPVTGPTDR